MVKPTKAWAVKHWRQGLYPETIRRTRRESIDAFKENFVSKPDDAFGKYEPNRAVKVLVIEDSPNIRFPLYVALTPEEKG